MRIFVVAFFVSISLVAFGAKKKNEKLPVLMQEFYKTLLEMKPFMISYEDFKNPQNKGRVQELLKNFEKKIDTTEVRNLKASGFDATYALLAKHLRDTSYLYEKEIYDTAWNNFRATTQFCIACHERLPKGVGKITWPSSSNFSSLLVSSQLREADFLYIGHQFEQSLEIYDHVIRSYENKSMDSIKVGELNEAYQRKIAFFARIQRDPKLAMASLKEDLKNKNLPLETKNNIETWIHYFDQWTKEGKKDPSLLNDTNLVDYARDIVDKSTGGRRITVSDPYIVNLLRVSGLLYERVFKQEKSPQAGEMLYLLGKCERELAPIRAYSLADIYFRDCILRSPKTPIAKKCYSEYELSIKQKYRSGASEYIDEGLNELHKLTE